MVSKTADVPIYPLRIVTQRLTSTPTERLPHVVPFLANTIAGCRGIFNHLESQEQGKDGSEIGLVVHKLRTHLSTLLQDKRVEGRWSAVVLIKATVEAGGWSILQGCGTWTRGLLAILNKPDPPATKKLCLITLARIFLLTQEHQSLVREITTPSIPPFVTSCLNVITLTLAPQEPRRLDITSPLLDTVLQVLIKLTPNHPSLLRPFVAQIRALLASLLAPTPSNITSEADLRAVRAYPSEMTVVLAQHLFALLPQCAPKNTSNEEYNKYLRATLDQIHRTADYIFRAVFEDHVSSARVNAVSATIKDYSDIVSDEVNDILELSGWRGIEAGCERLIGLLRLLQSTIGVESSSALTIPVGFIVLTIERVFSVIVPPKPDQQKSGLQARWNPEVDRDEREGMWLKLPQIHVAVIAVVSTLIDRLDVASIAILQGLLEQVLWVFRHENDCWDLRKVVYGVMSQILGTIGPSLSQGTVSSLSFLFRTLCSDLLDEEARSEASSNLTADRGKISSLKMSNADSYLKPYNISTKNLEVNSELHEAAAALLSSIFSHIDTSFLSVPIRTLIDRTAILTNNREAMFASVLNPESRAKGKQTSSILPFFARASGTTLELEGTLRPRMPILQQAKFDHRAIDAEEEEDIDMIAAYADHSVTQRESIAPTNNVGEEQIPTFTNDTLEVARKAQDASLNQMESTSTAVQHHLTIDSTKRSREADSSVDMGQSSKSRSVLPLNKRTRVEEENIEEKPPSQGYSTPFAPIYNKRPEKSDSGATESTIGPEVSASGNHAIDLATDSDDSFEIPPIILDSDSDDDEEESEDDDRMEDGEPRQDKEKENIV